MDLRHLRIEGDLLRVHLENVHGIGDAERTSCDDQLALHVRMHRAPVSRRPPRSSNHAERWPAHPGEPDGRAEKGARAPNAPNAASRSGDSLADHLGEWDGTHDSDGFWDWLQDVWDWFD